MHRVEKSRDAADRGKRTLKGEMKIIWDNVDFSWSEEEIEKAQKLWESGADLYVMCDALREKTPDKGAGYEVLFLLLYLAETKRIKTSKGGIIEWLMKVA